MIKIGRLVVDVYLTPSGELERADPVWIPVDVATEVATKMTTADHQWSPPVGHGGDHIAERESTTRPPVVTTAQSLSLSRGTESDSPPSGSSPLASGWWEARPDFEVLHRKFRWTLKPGGKTLHLLDAMAGHEMTGADDFAGQAWVAAQLEALKGSQTKRCVDHVYEKQFLPLLGPAVGPQADPAPSIATARDGRPTPAAASVRELVLRGYQELLEAGEQLTPQAAAEYERLTGGAGAASA